MSHVKGLRWHSWKLSLSVLHQTGGGTFVVWASVPGGLVRETFVQPSRSQQLLILRKVLWNWKTSAVFVSPNSQKDLFNLRQFCWIQSIVSATLVVRYSFLTLQKRRGKKMQRFSVKQKSWWSQLSLTQEKCYDNIWSKLNGLHDYYYTKLIVHCSTWSC